MQQCSNHDKPQTQTLHLIFGKIRCCDGAPSIASGVLRCRSPLVMSPAMACNRNSATTTKGPLRCAVWRSIPARHQAHVLPDDDGSGSKATSLSIPCDGSTLFRGTLTLTLTLHHFSIRSVGQTMCLFLTWQDLCMEQPLDPLSWLSRRIEVKG